MKRKIHELALLCWRHKPVIAGSALSLLLFAQVLYPSDRLPLATVIDGKKVGGWTKPIAIETLDVASNAQPIEIRIAGQTAVYKTVKPADFGLAISHSSRIENNDYPLLMRLIPTSLFWYHASPGQPEYRRDAAKRDEYIAKEFGKNCLFEPRNASLEYKEGRLQTIPAADGGKCDKALVRRQLDAAKPVISDTASVTVTVKPTPADITTKVAEETKAMIEKNLGQGITLTVEKDTLTIPKEEVYGWLMFKPDGKKLVVSLDAKKSDAYFDKDIAKRLLKQAGTTHITTRDFTEISRKNGQPGQALDRDATRSSIIDVLDGVNEKASAKPRTIQPVVEYTYTYTKSKTGIAALMRNFDREEKGVFGTALIELNGSGVASHQADKVFTTASTYKLFVAYGTLRKVEKGSWKWSDSTQGGRDMATCFDDMIVKSDNACAEVMLKKLGYNTLTNDIHALGLSSSGFTGEHPQTTANDLALFLTKLQRGDLPISSSSRSRLLSAMKRNVYRQGIPAGTSSTVADKVGFLDALLHDAAVVYSPKGTYVLVIMSDGSSWAKIAELTREIEKLR